MAEDSEQTYDAAADTGDEPKIVAGADSTAHFEPLVKLAEVKVQTGEEDEDVLYKERAKLYRFDNDSKEWKERGTGDVKLLQHKQTHKVRIILRQEKTLKICVNHVVAPLELKPNLGSDRAWTWSATDYADDDAALKTFAIKFKNPEVANAFKAAYDQARAINSGEAAPAAPVASASKKESPEDLWYKILNERQFQPLKQGDLKALWIKYDADSSNSIDAKELENLLRDLLMALLKLLKNEIPEEERKHVASAAPAITAKAFKTLDRNSDGKLSWDEFLRIDDVKIISE